MADAWLVIGLTLALELLFAIGVAIWTRWSANARLQGQTIWHVVAGVAGVVIISGLHIGLESATFVLLCFTVAFFPMAIEYFQRLKIEETKAQEAREESVDVNTGTDWKK